jgi:hypothetical protein
VQVPRNPDVVVEVRQGVADREDMLPVRPLQLVLLPVVCHLRQDLGSLNGEPGGRMLVRKMLV